MPRIGLAYPTLARLQEVLALPGGGRGQQHANAAAHIVPEQPPAAAQPGRHRAQRLAPVALVRLALLSGLASRTCKSRNAPGLHA